MIISSLYVHTRLFLIPGCVSSGSGKSSLSLCRRRELERETLFFFVPFLSLFFFSFDHSCSLDLLKLRFQEGPLRLSARDGIRWSVKSPAFDLHGSKLQGTKPLARHREQYVGIRRARAAGWGWHSLTHTPPPPITIDTKPFIWPPCACKWDVLRRRTTDQPQLLQFHFRNIARTDEPPGCIVCGTVPRLSLSLATITPEIKISSLARLQLGRT